MTDRMSSRGASQCTRSYKVSPKGSDRPRPRGLPIYRFRETKTSFSNKLYFLLSLELFKFENMMSNSSSHFNGSAFSQLQDYRFYNNEGGHQTLGGPAR